MRLASITHGRDGYSIWIENVPAWAWLIDQVTETVMLRWIDPALGHHLCAPRDWMYDLGVGTDPEEDEDLRLPHRWSLGQLAFTVTQSAGTLHLKRSKREMIIPVTREQVAEHFPDALSDWFDRLDDYDTDVSIDAARWHPERAESSGQ